MKNCRHWQGRQLSKATYPTGLGINFTSCIHCWGAIIFHGGEEACVLMGDHFFSAPQRFKKKF